MGHSIIAIIAAATVGAGAAFAFAGEAQGVEDTPNALRTEAKNVPIKEVLNRRSGGYIYQPLPEGSKVVSLIDRTDRGAGVLESFSRELEEDLKIPSVAGVSDRAAFTIELVPEGEISVNLTDGRAVVPAGGSDAETQAGLWKAMFALFSANASLSAKMSFRSQEGMVIGRRAMEAAGIEPVRRTTYKVAVEEGWAPPPTNDFQRAIWDAAHAAATNVATKGEAAAQ